MIVLTVLSALAGASAATTGIMLIFGAISLSDFDSAATTDRLNEDWWWFAIYAVLAVAGLIVQIRNTTRSCLDAGGMGPIGRRPAQDRRYLTRFRSSRQAIHSPSGARS